MGRMTKVLLIGTSVATIAYAIDGIFGAATWSKNTARDDEMNKQNILMCSYG